MPTEFAGYERPDSGAAPPRYTLVYDGECEVCLRSAGAIRRWDRDDRIELVAFQDPGVMQRFPWIPHRAFVEAVQLVGPGRETWTGADAVEQVLDVLPKGRFVSWVFKVPLVRRLARRAYRSFARNRHRIGCHKHCRMRRRVLAGEDVTRE